MKITVTTSSQSLDELLSTAQKDAIKDTRIQNGVAGNYGINIYNASGAVMYIEAGSQDASAAEGRPIAATADFNLVSDELSSIKLIASSGSLDARIIIV